MAARVAAKSEINITPFVDVMLVLLIIFMVAAPLATTNLKITIPPPGAVQPPPLAPVFISLDKAGAIRVGSELRGESAGDWHSLLALLGAKTNGERATPIFVRADRDVGYGEVVRLIDQIRAAGYAKVSIVTEDIGD